MDCLARVAWLDTPVQNIDLRVRWKFKFDTARVRFGCCWYDRQLITLAKALVEINSEEEVRDTILHEIAHALTPNDRGHGQSWKNMARKVGAKPERCYSSLDVATITYHWMATCKLCNRNLGERVQRNCPGIIACYDCFNQAKAAGIHFNVGEHTAIFKKIKTIIRQPRGTARTAAPEPIVVCPPPAVLMPPAIVFSPVRCITLYNAGTKVVDIAVAMGYPRGSGQNRVRTVLIKAGAYREVTKR